MLPLRICAHLLSGALCLLALGASCSETPSRHDLSDGNWIHLRDARPDRPRVTLDLLPPDLVSPGSDRCQGAAPVTLTDGKASVQGTTAGASNEYGTGIRCGEVTPLLGPQRYYRFQLALGMSYRFELKPIFDAAFYLVSSCGQNAINADCGSGGATGAITSVPAGGSGAIYFAPSSTGEYRLVVDSSSPSGQGAFELSAEEFPVPANASCTTPKALKLSEGKLSVQGTTLGARNEFEQQIRCGLGVDLAGPQVYYSVNLVLGAWFQISLAPSFPATLYLANSAAGCLPANIDVDCGGLTGNVLPGVPAGSKGATAFAPLSSGSYLIAVDSADPKAAGTFTLSIESIVPPAGMICALAIELSLAGGGVSVQGSTAGLQNDLGAHASCSGQISPLVGPQIYYRAALKQGTYQLGLKPSFAARLLLGQSCSTLPIDCASAGLTGLALAVPAGKTGSTLFSTPSPGEYVIAVDSAAIGAAGPFSLELKEYVVPSNGSCATPRPVALVKSPVLELGSTGPFADDLTGVSCGTKVGPFAGPQAYYKLALKGGTSYTIELEPEAGFDPALYAFAAATPCVGGAVNASCQGLVSDQVGIGIKEKLTLTPQQDADYLVVVDSWSPSEVGSFSLAISWN